jgi:hypothetical protein
MGRDDPLVLRVHGPRCAILRLVQEVMAIDKPVNGVKMGVCNIAVSRIFEIEGVVK